MGLVVMRWRMLPLEATHAVRGDMVVATHLGPAGGEGSSWWPRCTRWGLG